MTTLAPYAAARPAHRAERRRPRPRVLGWLVQSVAWAGILFIGAALLAGLVVPKAAGATTYTIETGSMRPQMPPGTLVVISPVTPAEVRVGDVITYQLRSGDPTVVTHRVVAMGYDGRGRRSWKTQGDANSAADPKMVQPQQLRGRLWYHVPRLGFVSAMATPQQRGLIVGVMALGLGGYAVLMFSGAWRDRRRGRVRATTG